MELLQQKAQLQATIQRIEQEKNEQFATLRLNEERHKLQLEENQKERQKCEEKWRAKYDLSQAELENASFELSQATERQRRVEDDGFKKQSGFDKLYALVEQKLQLTERELAECKKRLSTKEIEHKDSQKEVQKARKELIQISNQMNIL